MLIRLAELLQCDPQKVAELSCMSGICHVMEQMTLDRVFRCKSRHWTDFASICGLNRLVESGGRIFFPDTSDRVHKVSHWITATIAALDLCRKPGRPKGENLPTVGATSCESMGWVGWGCTGNFLLIIYHYHSVSYCHHHWFILWYVLWQSVTIIFSSVTSFVVDGFGSFRFSFPMICSGPVDHVLLFLFLFYISEFPFNDGNFWCSLICWSVFNLWLVYHYGDLWN